MRRLKRKPIGSDSPHFRFASMMRILMSEKSVTFRDRGLNLRRILSEKSATFRDRAVVFAAVLAGTVAPAAAGDFDLSWLRGSTTDYPTPAPYRVWSGFYGGGQLGADFREVDFTKVGGQYINEISTFSSVFSGIPLSSFPRLSAENIGGPSYGGFVGYNYQIDDIVMGLEFNFNKSTLNASINDSQSHSYFVTANSFLYDTKYTVTTAGAAAIADYGTFRGRLAWAFGSFLPYVFGGLSIAQINGSSSVNVIANGVPDPSDKPPLPANIGANWTLSDTSHGKWYFGPDVGLGVDYALTKNIFLRGELEYIKFGSPNQISLSTTNARVGLGFKF
jgi:outer membrane immunogenic protein